MGCGRPLADPPALLLEPLLINFVLDGAHGLLLGGYRTAPTADDTDRGYTGHLHTDGIGLIYMNARFYVGETAVQTVNRQWLIANGQRTFFLSRLCAFALRFLTVCCGGKRPLGSLLLCKKGNDWLTDNRPRFVRCLLSRNCA